MQKSKQDPDVPEMPGLKATQNSPPASPLTDVEKQELLKERKETIELYRRLLD